MQRYLALDMGAESGRLMSVTITDQISTEEIHRFQTPVALILEIAGAGTFQK